METKEPILWPCWGLYYSEQIRGWREAYTDASLCLWEAVNLPVALLQVVSFLAFSFRSGSLPDAGTCEELSVIHLSSFSSDIRLNRQFLQLLDSMKHHLPPPQPHPLLLLRRHHQPPHQPPASWMLLVTSHTLLSGSLVFVTGRERRKESECEWARVRTPSHRRVPLTSIQDGQAKRVARRGEQHGPQANAGPREQTGLSHGLQALRHVSRMFSMKDLR